MTILVGLEVGRRGRGRHIEVVEELELVVERGDADDPHFAVFHFGGDAGKRALLRSASRIDQRIICVKNLP